MTAAERVEQALRGVDSGSGPLSARMLRVVEAGLLALAAEVDNATTPDAASAEEPPPPVRELPTGPGAVVLARVVRGREFTPPILLIRSTSTSYTFTYGHPMWFSPTEQRWHLDEHIGEWEPAEVVDAGDDGPRAALDRIANLPPPAPSMTPHELVQALRFIARRALARMDGATT